MSDRRPSNFAETPLPEGYEFFTKVVDDLISRSESAPFRKPVSYLWSEEEMPEYYQLIDKPMDLGTVKARLENGKYNKNEDEGRELNERAIRSDILLTFNNCMAYNEPGCELYNSAQFLKAIALSWLREHGTEFTGFRNQEQDFNEKLSFKRSRALDLSSEESIKKNEDRENTKQALEKGEESVTEPNVNGLYGFELPQKLERNGRVRKKPKRLIDTLLTTREDSTQKKAASNLMRKSKQKIIDSEIAPIVESDEEMIFKNSPNRPVRIRKQPERLIDILLHPHSNKTRSKNVAASNSSNRDEEKETQPSTQLKEDKNSSEPMSRWVQGNHGQMEFMFVYIGERIQKTEEMCKTGKMLLERHKKLRIKRHEFVQSYLKDQRVRMKAKMTENEKETLRVQVITLAHAKMEQVAKILREFLDDPSIVNDIEIDVPFDSIDNLTLRKIQTVINHPRFVNYDTELESLNQQIASVEKKYLKLRYENVTAKKEADLTDMF